ncbi:hypothetical protein ACQP1V_27345 [Microtetraspora malaysiensis]|uniref:hypothetical protein n=1 Tax=Microtetraspora malaysiensis TaxID=161358 RepID=UPI003D8A83A7
MTNLNEREVLEFGSKLLWLLGRLEDIFSKGLFAGIALMFGAAFLVQLAAWAAGLDSKTFPDGIFKYPGNLPYLGYVGVGLVGRTSEEIGR